jgi:hypothetical protein
MFIPMSYLLIIATNIAHIASNELLLYTIEDNIKRYIDCHNAITMRLPQQPKRQRAKNHDLCQSKKISSDHRYSSTTNTAALK